ncbi:FAD synthetase 1, chloroplastic-like [Silene latifolia]|uniref:FAD synthetase 1, chloroplastic-like n=1 Tax=Silene latifolia TaxID=37657 RepID=UPI003D76F3D1
MFVHVPQIVIHPLLPSSQMRIPQHLKEWEGLGIYTSSISSSKLIVSSLIKPGFLKVLPFQNNNCITVTPSSSSYVGISLPFISCIHSMSPHHSPILSDSSFRPKEYELEKSSEGLPSIAGGIVALGKFDALHVGHRELAIQASKVGTPFLLSFVGMAQVFGWAPRAPIVAKCDRERVLSSWAPLCGNVPPKEFMIDFSRVRHLTPSQFVEKLSKEFGVHGVVAGENYRFGYKAAGDASELVRLCDEYGMKAYILNSVMDKNKDRDDSYPLDKKDMGQVSSTRVRHALSKGDMKYVSKLLGRHHRLFLSAEWLEDLDGPRTELCAPLSSLLNLPPKDGVYDNCYLLVGDEIELACRVVIDSSHIRLESDEKECNIHDAVKGLQLVGIEFRG